ncbi:transposase [Microcystis aeruginosa str. Chao 1910]|nr:transposase [Microcystis aeruginosa str. Chao 1910]
MPNAQVVADRFHVMKQINGRFKSELHHYLIYLYSGT